VLNNMGIRNVIVTGIYTDQCVSSTVRSLADESFNVVLVEDCCAAGTDELHRHELAIINMIYCHVVSSAELREIMGLALAASPLSAADPDVGLSRIELTDGSVVIGEVLGMSGGVYSVRTPSLGTLGIESSRIRAIRQRMRPDRHATGAGSDTGLANPGSDYGAQVESMQRQMVGNADVMQMIVGLQNDPALQRAMADPELMGLISSGNLDAIREHPSFRALMNHPGIRAIVEQMQAVTPIDRPCSAAACHGPAQALRTKSRTIAPSSFAKPLKHRHLC
jgi:hypothetical protein